jgi:hypothetical protein
LQTVVGHRSEVLAFVINADETRMISGTMDPEFKLWSIGEPPADRQADGDTELDLVCDRRAWFSGEPNVD